MSNTSPPTRSPHLSPGRIAALVVGAVALLIGLGVTVGSASTLAGYAIATDDDGFVEFTLDRLDTDGLALSADDIRFDADEGPPDWLLERLDVDVRLSITPAADSDELFVGIARSADVESYVAGVEHADIVDVDGRTPIVRDVAGSRTIGDPDDQDFWVVSSSGAGTQRLEWRLEPGRWAVVVMNPDGSRGVAADAEVAIASGVVLPLAVTGLVGGLVLLVAGTAIVVVVARRRSGGLAGGTEVRGPIGDIDGGDLGTARDAPGPLVDVGGLAPWDPPSRPDAEFVPGDGDDASVPDALPEHASDRVPQRT